MGVKKTSDATSARLVTEAQQGNQDAFSQLIEAHYDSAFAIAMARLRDKDVAEDLVQEVFLRVFFNISKLRDRNRFGAWVGRLTRNLAIDWQRRQIRSSSLVRMVPMNEAVEATVADPTGVTARQQLDEQRRRERANALLAELEDDDREIVLLHYREGFTPGEIAERLGVHRTTIGRRLEKVTSWMRERSEEIDATSLKSIKMASPEFAHRAIGVVAAASLTSGAAREAIMAAAAKGTTAALGASSSSGGSVAPVSALLALLKTSSATAAQGVATMGIAKLTIGAAAAAVIGLAGFNMTNSNSSGFGGGSDVAAVAPMPTQYAYEQTFEFEGERSFTVPVGESFRLELGPNPYNYEYVRGTVTDNDSVIIVAKPEGDDEFILVDSDQPTGAGAPERLFMNYQFWPEMRMMHIAMLRYTPMGSEMKFDYFAWSQPDLVDEVQNIRNAYRAGQISEAQMTQYERQLVVNADGLPQDSNLRQLAIDFMDFDQEN